MLVAFDITLERGRGEVVRIVGVGQETIAGQMPFTPVARRVLERSLREALDLGHGYIGTEHLLLALLTLGEGVSARPAPAADARRARALEEGRGDIQPRDLLLALTRDEQTGPVLADLGVGDVGILRALERRRPPGGPHAPAGG